MGNCLNIHRHPPGTTTVTGGNVSQSNGSSSLATSSRAPLIHQDHQPILPIGNNSCKNVHDLDRHRSSDTPPGSRKNTTAETPRSATRRPHLNQSSISSDQQSTILIALYPYDSRADGDLSFQKGDQMLLLDDSNADWWYVQHLRTGGSGYVPRNFVAKQQTVESEEWYAGRIPRNRAERLVLQNNLPRGTFLIREREADTREFALTIRDSDDQRGGSVKHYKIKRLDDEGGFFITTRRTFKTLQELVRYYSEVADGLCCQLTFPAPRIAPTRPELSHDTQQNWEIPRN